MTKDNTKKEKKYEIKTIEDILNVVTADNMECFLKDFSAWLSLNITAQIADKIMGETADIRTSGTFTWIDDGKNDMNIKVEITNT